MRIIGKVICKLFGRHSPSGAYRTMFDHSVEEVKEKESFWCDSCKEWIDEQA